MKRIFKLTTLSAIAFCITSCQHQENQSVQQPTTDTEAIMASIDSLGQVVQKAHDTNDSKLMASTWAEDGVLIIAGNPPIFGRDSIVSALSKMPALPPNGKMEIHPLDLQILSPEWAYVIGVDSLKYTAPGATSQTIKTSTFFVLIRKTEDGWKTYRETLTPNEETGIELN